MEEYNDNGNYGTYISETYLGLSRLCSWFFFHVFSIPNIKSGKKYEFKVTKKAKPWEQRSNDEMEQWLSSRRVKNVKGKTKKILIQKISEIKRDPRVLKKMEENGDLLPNPNDCSNMLISLSALLSRVFGTCKLDLLKKGDHFNALIKIFLNTVYNFEQKIVNNEERNIFVPIIISK